MTLASSDDIITFLEWAGAKLVAMPGGRIGPRDSGVIWPDFSLDSFQVLDFRVGLSVRAAAPSSHEIPLVDEILTLPSLCSTANIRRTVRARTLIHPITHRHLYPWTRIAKLLSTHPKIARRWFTTGIREIAASIPDLVFSALVVKMDDYI